jgi:hypothetical protein
MVPIHVSEGNSSFTCPLPKRYKELLICSQEIAAEIDTLKKQINSEAMAESGPFVNIMIEYRDRTEEQKKELKKMMSLQRLFFDQRGLYGALAGFDVNSGDIYLDSNASPNCDYTVMSFEQFFEDNLAFQCHNVDFYWQALLCRELTVRYFNFLNTI